MADGRADPVGEWVAGIFVVAARMIGLDAVADAELLERLANLRNGGPVKILEADVVRDSDVLAQFALREAPERAVHGLGAHRLRA